MRNILGVKDFSSWGEGWSKDKVVGAAISSDRPSHWLKKSGWPPCVTHRRNYKGDRLQRGEKASG